MEIDWAMVALIVLIIMGGLFFTSIAVFAPDGSNEKEIIGQCNIACTELHSLSPATLDTNCFSNCLNIMIKKECDING